MSPSPDYLAVFRCVVLVLPILWLVAQGHENNTLNCEGDDSPINLYLCDEARSRFYELLCNCSVSKITVTYTNFTITDVDDASTSESCANMPTYRTFACDIPSEGNETETCRSEDSSCPDGFEAYIDGTNSSASNGTRVSITLCNTTKATYDMCNTTCPSTSLEMGISEEGCTLIIAVTVVCVVLVLLLPLASVVVCLSRRRKRSKRMSKKVRSYKPSTASADPESNGYDQTRPRDSHRRPSTESKNGGGVSGYEIVTHQDNIAVSDEQWDRYRYSDIVEQSDIPGVSTTNQNGYYELEYRNSHASVQDGQNGAVSESDKRDRAYEDIDLSFYRNAITRKISNGCGSSDNHGGLEEGGGAVDGVGVGGKYANLNQKVQIKEANASNIRGNSQLLENLKQEYNCREEQGEASEPLATTEKGKQNDKLLKEIILFQEGEGERETPDGALRSLQSVKGEGNPEEDEAQGQSHQNGKVTVANGLTQTLPKDSTLAGDSKEKTRTELLQAKPEHGRRGQEGLHDSADVFKTSSARSKPIARKRKSLGDLSKTKSELPLTLPVSPSDSDTQVQFPVLNGGIGPVETPDTITAASSSAFGDSSHPDGIYYTLESKPEDLNSERPGSGVSFILESAQEDLIEKAPGGGNYFTSEQLPGNQSKDRHSIQNIVMLEEGSEVIV
ncbi:hypothetical protein PoB_004672800 [Plakobranchus ocellatus]|uniref:Uncharacterized protein n=1 Tax=Plakobranchus ocellatus TaxID=259542 RepID=A0AAV4BM39_9GAST|nr:hypothetical protein PoB_004672800 [Plakobranchus ocellatus]